MIQEWNEGLLEGSGRREVSFFSFEGFNKHPKGDLVWITWGQKGGHSYMGPKEPKESVESAN